MKPSPYPVLMLAGIVVSGIFWSRLARKDERLVLIYAAALGGAFAGAKLAYLASEGWLHFGQTGMWLQLATGKSIVGALLGGYGAVELAKKYSGYTEATGDWFATIVPVAVVLPGGGPASGVVYHTRPIWRATLAGGARRDGFQFIVRRGLLDHAQEARAAGAAFPYLPDGLWRVPVRARVPQGHAAAAGRADRVSSGRGGVRGAWAGWVYPAARGTGGRIDD